MNNLERTHLDLFSGIGGFALAARANGVRTVQFVEIDPRCRDFLAKAWPGVPIHDDIRTFAVAYPKDKRERPRLSRKPERVAWSESGGDAEQRTPSVWLLTGGVPCQPASRAGKQRGKEDDRWLWPEAVRVIAAVKPTWALLENPPGIGDVGLRGILSQVEAQGYKVRVLSIPACAVGSPHRRERFWIVAHTTQRGQREHGGTSGQRGYADERGQSSMGYAAEHESESGSTQPSERRLAQADSSRCLANPEPARHKVAEWCGIHSTGRNYQRTDCVEAMWENCVWLPCADGKVRRAPDDSFGLVDGLHRSLLGALGNSIVPQVAAKIIAAMIQSEEQP